MMKGILIADSGGTSTKWIHSSDSNWSFSMESLHPRRIGELSNERKNELKALFSSLEYDEVHFYGAGCSSNEAKESIITILSELGLKKENIIVETDALLACKAALGSESGYVAIFGTGSILLHYNGSEIVETFGGFGAIIGDEGSALSFGKLFLKEYLLNQNNFSIEIRELIGERKQVLGELAKSSSLAYISNLAVKLSNQDLNFIHERNIQLFFDLYLPSEIHEKISFVGSYAFFQEKNIEKILHAYNWCLGTIIQDPLSSIRTTYNR